MRNDFVGKEVCKRGRIFRANFDAHSNPSLSVGHVSRVIRNLLFPAPRPSPLWLGFGKPRGASTAPPFPAGRLQIPSCPALAHVTPEQDGRHDGHCGGWQLWNGKGGRRGVEAERVGAFCSFPLGGAAGSFPDIQPHQELRMEEGFSGRTCPPSLGLGGGLRSWWTRVLIGSFRGWEPGTPPNWSEEAVSAFLLASQSWEGFLFQNIIFPTFRCCYPLLSSPQHRVLLF